MTQAANGYAGFGLGTSDSTAPTMFLPTQEINISSNNQEIETREMIGTRQNKKTYDGSIEVEATLKTALYPVGALGLLMKGLFGVDVKTTPGGGTLARKHAFGNAKTLPELVVERSDAFATEGHVLCERISGAKVNSISVSAAFGEVVNVDVNIMGRTVPTNPTPQTRAAVIAGFPDIEACTFAGVEVSIDGVASDLFKTVNFEVTNNLERTNTLRKRRDAKKVYENATDVTLSATAELDSDLYSKFQTADVFALTLVFESDSIIESTDNYRMEVTFPNVRILNSDQPFTGEGVVDMDLEFSVRNMTGSMIQVDFYNDEDIAY